MTYVSIVYVASRIIPAALNLLSIRIFYLLLGPIGYGHFVILNSLVLMSSNVGGTWLVQSTLRYRSGYVETEEAATHERALQWGALISAGLAVLVVGIFLAIRGEAWVAILAVLMALSALLWYAIAATKAQADMHPLRFFFAEATRGVSLIAVSVGLLLLGFREPYVPILGVLVGNLLGLAIYASRSEKKSGLVPTVAGTEVLAVLRNYASYGLPLVAWMGVSVLINTGDRFIIESVLGPGSLGLYAAITEMTYKTVIVILMPLGLAFTPVIMRAWNEGDQEGAYAAIRTTILVTVGIGGVMVVGFALGGDLLQSFATGTTAPDGRAMVVLAATAAALWQLGVVLQKPLEIQNRTRLLAALALVGWGGQLTVLLVFLPRVGILAASCGLALASATYCVLVMLAVKWKGPSPMPSEAPEEIERALRLKANSLTDVDLISSRPQ